MMDYAVPLKDIQAETVAEALANMFTICVPKEILSDQGCQFLSTVMNEMCRHYTYAQTYTQAYTQTLDPLVVVGSSVDTASGRDFNCLELLYGRTESILRVDDQ